MLFTSKVTLLNDDTLDIEVCATVIVSSFGQIEQGVHIIYEESVYGARSGRASL